MHATLRLGAAYVPVDPGTTRVLAVSWGYERVDAALVAAALDQYVAQVAAEPVRGAA